MNPWLLTIALVAIVEAAAEPGVAWIAPVAAIALMAIAVGWTRPLRQLSIEPLARRLSILLAVAALTVGLALRAFAFARTSPFAKGEMLSLVLRASRALFDGHSPYATYHFPWPVPLTYWPGTLLAYAPAQLLHYDVRWTNVAAELVIATLVVRLGGRRVVPVVAAWFLLPGSLEWTQITAAPVGWAAIALTLAALATDHRRADVALGLAVATTPFSWPLVPLALLRWRKTASLRRAAVTAGVAMLLILPFFLWAPRAFIEGTVLWFNQMDGFPRSKWIESRTWARYTGLAGVFWSLGLERLLKPFQLVAVGVIVWRYARRGATAALVPAFATAILIVFVALNPVIWPYLYQPAIVAALLALAVSDSAGTAA